MKLPPLLRATALAFIAALPARAIDFSFTGNLANDNDVQFFNFTAGTESLVTIQTLSYAGGTNAENVVIPRGGFDPILGLFSSAGTRIAVNDDDPVVPVDPVSGGAFDAFIQLTLPPGTYSVSISQWANYPGLTITDLFPGSGTTGFFDPVTQTQRTSFFAVDVLNVDTNLPPTGNVPDSGSTLLLLTFALLGTGAIRRNVGAF